ncbi:MAG TPA: hypothetical protein VJ843_06125 [Candidatus Saccharimonadales bacterium]|nr:hypothetical protein [Candidatus Saccharimonadales bacterium]
MSAQATIPVNVNEQAVGYIVNAGVSVENQENIESLQKLLIEKHPGIVWAAPGPSLHVTLLDWLTPTSSYDMDKDALFASIQKEYMEAIIESLRSQPPIQITFDTLEVHPAAIIVRGHDNGAFQRIRSAFMSRVNLLPNTKQPPAIIHTTICKFQEKSDLDKIRNTLLGTTVKFQETIKEFRLVRESQVYMLNFQTIKKFKLH